MLSVTRMKKSSTKKDYPKSVIASGKIDAIYKKMIDKIKENA